MGGPCFVNPSQRCEEGGCLLGSIPTDLGHLPGSWMMCDLGTVVVPGPLFALGPLEKTGGLSKDEEKSGWG